MDMGYGFELETTRLTGLIVIFGSFLFTVAIYLIGRKVPRVPYFISLFISVLGNLLQFLKIVNKNPFTKERLFRMTCDQKISKKLILNNCISKKIFHKKISEYSCFYKKKLL